jgi:hypothetical protein
MGHLNTQGVQQQKTKLWRNHSYHTGNQFYTLFQVKRVIVNDVMCDDYYIYVSKWQSHRHCQSYRRTYEEEKLSIIS